MKEQIKKREVEFKVALQKSEREIMNTFAFKQELPYGKSAHATLGETMNLVGDHIVISYNTVFEGSDLKNVSKKMRKVDPKFSDESKLMRDVQITLDENYINYLLFSLFHNESTFSLSEILLSFIPENLATGAGTAVKAIMNTQTWSFLFPELLNDYKKGSRVDFRCGFNKEYL